MLARLTVSTSVVETRGTVVRAPHAVCSADRMTGPPRPSRNPCFSAPCWNGASRDGLERARLDGHAAHRGGQLVVLGVERAHRRGEAEDAPQLAALAGDGSGDAAEVLVELLAVDREPLLTHELELAGQGGDRGDRGRRIGRKAGRGVARDGF